MCLLKAVLWAALASGAAAASVRCRTANAAFGARVLNADSSALALSWATELLPGAQQGQGAAQLSYAATITAAGSGALVWSSGTVVGDAQQLVVPQGAGLAPGTAYSWHVELVLADTAATAQPPSAQPPSAQLKPACPALLFDTAPAPA